MNSIIITDNQNRPLLTLTGKADDLDNLEPHYQKWLKEFYDSGVIMPAKKITSQNSAMGSSLNFVKAGDPNFLECLVNELRKSRFATENNLQIFYESKS